MKEREGYKGRGGRQMWRRMDEILTERKKWERGTRKTERMEGEKEDKN